MDIFKEEELAPYIKDSDAVVSCLGGRASLFGWTPSTLYTDSMKSIVGAMRRSGVKRLVAISSWGTAGITSVRLQASDSECHAPFYWLRRTAS